MPRESRPEAEFSPTPRRAAEIMEKLISAADVSKVYGEPIRQGKTLLIPDAELFTIAGFRGALSDAARRSRLRRGRATGDCEHLGRGRLSRRRGHCRSR